jgi:anti-anti-sigma factor
MYPGRARSDRVNRTEVRVPWIEEGRLKILNRVIMSDDGLRIQFSSLRPGVPLVEVSGPLNEVAAEDLRRHLDEHLDRRPWAIVLDLTSVSSIDPGAVSSLADIAQRAGAADVGFYLVAPDHVIDRAISGDGLVDLFDIHASIDSALRTLGGLS